MKTTFTYIYFEEDYIDGYGVVWNAKNRMFKNTIGKLTKSIGTCAVKPEWCYTPIPHSWHQSLMISTTNLKDILKFIKQLEK